MRFLNKLSSVFMKNANSSLSKILTTFMVYANLSLLQ